MPNNYLSVLYKHIIQVENKNVGLKVGWGGEHKHTIAPNQKKRGGGAHAHIAPPPASYASACLVESTNTSLWAVRFTANKLHYTTLHYTTHYTTLH